MTTTNTVARFADMHSGFKLVDRRDIALPFFELTLDVMAERRQELPVIDEYVLRFASLGLGGLSDLTGLLGLEPAVVQRSVLALLQADHVDYQPGQDGRVVELTTSGRLVLEERMQEVPERMEVRMGFDRLLWKLSPRWMTHFENPRFFKDGAATLIKPIRGRRPELNDVEMAVLNKAMQEVPVRRREQTEIDIVQVLDVGARTKLLRAEMLIFIADDDSAIRASFIIDDHHSPDHDRAFVGAGGLSRIGIELADPENAKAEVLQLPDAVEALRPSSLEVATVEKRLRAATRMLEDTIVGADLAEVIEGVASEPVSSTRDRLRSREQELELVRSELEEAKRAQLALPIRSIQTFEHPELLTVALATATSRFLLIAPWIKTEVVNDSFIRSLRTLCEKGVPVHIGYGFQEYEDQKNDAEALKRLTYLANKHDNFVFSKLGNTHAKVLVWEDTMVVTSFNWLSFQGDRYRKYRQEEGTLINVKDFVDAEYERHSSNIVDSQTGF